MFCPKCSAEASMDQKFCRGCGMELQPVALLVQNDDSSQTARKGESRLAKRHRAMLLWGCVTMFVAVAVGASLKVLGKEGIRPAGEFTPYLSVVALLAVFFAMGMMCLAMLENISPRRRSRDQASGVEQSVNSPVQQLSDQPPAITEMTTEFLEDAAAAIRVRDTAPHSE